MTKPDLAGPNDPSPQSPEIAPEVLTVFRSRRARTCEGCGGEIAPGQDYLRQGFGAFHRHCLSDGQPEG